MNSKQLLIYVFLLYLFPHWTVAQELKTLQKNISKAYLNGNIEEAISLSEQVLKIAQQDEKLPQEEYAILLENTAKLYLETEQYEEAEKLYVNIKEIRLATLGHQHLDYATALDNLAMVYQANGNYSKAEPILLISKEIREKNTSKLHPDYAQTLDNLAMVYENLGLYAKAESYFWEAKDIREKTIGKKNSDYANTLHNLAELYAKQKNYSKAIKFYEDCLQLTAKLEGKNSASYATTLDGLAAVYIKTNQYEDAQTMIKRSMEITEKLYSNSHTDYALSLNTLADILKAKKQYASADSAYKESLFIFERNLGKQHHYYTNTLFNLAKLYTEQQQLETAHQLYLEVIERKKHEMQKVFPVLSDNEKLIFYKNIKLFFNHFIQFALQYAKKEPKILQQVFENQLLIKGLLGQNTKKIKKQILSSNNQNLINQYQNLQKKQEALALLFYRDTKNLRMAEVQKLTKTQYELELEINQLEKQLSTQLSTQLHHQLQSPKLITWDNFVTHLAPNQVAIELIRLVNYTDSIPEISYLVFAISSKTKDYPVLKLLKNGNELEKSALKFYQYSLAEQRTDTESYQQYWLPIKQMIDSLQGNEPTKKIYFCADGVYHQINLNTLLNTETGNYLAEDTQIYSLTNMKDIMQASTHSTNSPQNIAVLVIGQNDDLQAIKGEIAQIDTLLKRHDFQTVIYADSNTLEKNIKQLKNPFILHLATHGFFQKNETTQESNTLAYTEDNPLLQSGLWLVNNSPSLAVTGEEDNILTAYEVTHLQLDSTDLVVLAACETGVGKIHDGEGIFGLQRAFSVAGAKTLLMSLWKVNDRATELLMTSFYANLLQDKLTKHEALKKAQQTVREKYPHPYFWGAFVLVGE